MRDKPDACYASQCPLADKGRGFVLDYGDPLTAEYALVLEAPGHDEIQFRIEPNARRWFLSTKEECDRELAVRRRDFPGLDERFIRTGVPAVGATGSVLEQWLFPVVGMRRDKLFIANTLRCLPPKSKRDAYPKGEERKAAERCCRQWDRWDKFRPDAQLVTLHPAAILRDVTPLPLEIEDFKKARDFRAAGRRVMILLGGKAMKAFTRIGENVSKFRGHYLLLARGWAESYKQTFNFTAKHSKRGQRGQYSGQHAPCKTKTKTKREREREQFEEFEALFSAPRTRARAQRAQTGAETGAGAETRGGTRTGTRTKKGKKSE